MECPTKGAKARTKNELTINREKRSFSEKSSREGGFEEGDAPWRGLREAVGVRYFILLSVGVAGIWNVRQKSKRKNEENI